MHRAPTLPALFRASAVALACLAAGSAAQAQSSVQAYGLVDLSAGQFQSAGGLKVKALDSGDMATSYIGFKGSEDLGGGLRAGFQLESFIQVDTGQASRVAGVDAFWARNANVSLSGGFGTIKLGRQGPALFVSTLLFNPLVDSFGYSPAIRLWYNSPHGTPLVGDSGWSNAIGYTTPNYGGLSANVQVAAGENAATAKGHNVGGNVLYFGGPIALTAAWQSVKVQGVLGPAISSFPGFTGQTAYQFGGSYDAGVVKLYAQYGTINTSANANVTSKIYTLGASVPLGAGSLIAEYGSSKKTTDGSSTTLKNDIATGGYDYFLSKRTDVYAILLFDKYTTAKHGSTYAVGLKHTF